MLPKALNCCTKENKSPNLVTLLVVTFLLTECAPARAQHVVRILRSKHNGGSVQQNVFGQYCIWPILLYNIKIRLNLSFITSKFEAQIPNFAFSLLRSRSFTILIPSQFGSNDA